MVLTAQCHAEIATKEILAITSMGHVQEDVIQVGKKIPVHNVSPLYYIECSSNTYGVNCSMSCGNCYEGDTCNHLNGTCAGGCDPGWQEDTCLQGKPTN